MRYSTDTANEYFSGYYGPIIVVFKTGLAAIEAHWKKRMPLLLPATPAKWNSGISRFRLGQLP